MLTAIVAAGIVLGGAGAAWANWTASSSGAGGASADAFPTTPGTKPGVSTSGGTATLTFAAVMTNGVKQPASSYTIKRFDAAGTTLQSSATGACTTTSGTVTCTVGSVPDGQWTFGYLPLLGSWAGQDSNVSNVVFADSVAPTVSAAAIGPSSGFAVGSIHQGGTYYVYANSTDTTSGVASVTANVSTVTTGSTTAALTSTGGPWTVGGTQYAYRSAMLTANATLTAGSKSFAVTATDNASNSATTTSTVTVDNTPPNTPTGLDMTAATDSGSSSTDNITNFAKPIFTGSTDPTTTVNLVDGATLVGTGTSDSSGNFSITLTTTLTDGSHTITARAVDAADNVSGSSGGVTITVDTTAPTGASMTATNHGTAGQIDKNGSNRDTLELTFSEAIAPANVVAGWNGSGSQTINVTFTNGGTGNDSITIPGLGTVDLGSTTWLSATSTKSESLTMTGSTFTLAIDTVPTGNTSGNAASNFTWNASGGTAKDVAGNGAVGSIVANSQRF